MAIAAASSCCQQANVALSDTAVVFASRHGEMGVTVDLLSQMASGEALSPMDFSGSVHHAAIGYLSIAAENRHPMRAVAAGLESFCYGFLDAAALVAESPDVPVLLIAAEDSVPPPFDALVGKAVAPHAAAFLLAPPKAGASLNITLSFTQKKGKPRFGIAALDFLQWLTMEEKTLELCPERKVWRWEK
jgi:hypothetical protein